MNTCAQSGAANDGVCSRAGVTDFGVNMPSAFVTAELLDAPVSNNPMATVSGRFAEICVERRRRRNTGASELLDAPVSNNRPRVDLKRTRRNSLGARPAPKVFASNVLEPAALAPIAPPLDAFDDAACHVRIVGLVAGPRFGEMVTGLDGASDRVEVEDLPVGDIATWAAELPGAQQCLAAAIAAEHMRLHDILAFGQRQPKARSGAVAWPQA